MAVYGPGVGFKACYRPWLHATLTVHARKCLGAAAVSRSRRLADSVMALLRLCLVVTGSPDDGDTFLTERQAEVLAHRAEGLTQREIAERLGTSVSNISAVERAARRNIERSRRTIALARVLRCAVRFTVDEGADLRDLIDRIYETADQAGVRLAYAEPELATLLGERLGDRLVGRRLTEEVEIGLTGDGDVVAYPSAVPFTGTGTD